jgi:hypothetical protein
MGWYGNRQNGKAETVTVFQKQSTDKRESTFFKVSFTLTSKNRYFYFGTTLHTEVI